MEEKWIVKYDNDTGYNDEGFWEWWIVTTKDGSGAEFKCEYESNAKWLADVLNGKIKPSKD